MKAKKQYYKLDDVGFIGAQASRSKEQIKNDASKTARSIKAHKGAKGSSRRSITPAVGK
jgi:hypothetical protein